MAGRVLIVDDSMLMRRMIADVLVDAGWKVVGEATHGEEAVECYQRMRPDVVTMDIVMPGMGGVHALAKIVEFDPDARVVVVSALSQVTLIKEAIRKGARDFLVKPFLPEQLRETLERAVAQVVNA
jgi:two-component system, chemotaxis family, chemotaxis protein CheY